MLRGKPNSQVTLLCLKIEDFPKYSSTFVSVAMVVVAIKFTRASALDNKSLQLINLILSKG